MQLGPPWTKQASEESSVCGTACGSWKRKGARSLLCFVRLKARWLNENAMQLDYVRSEIERMRTQIHRQRGEIHQLQRRGCGAPLAPRVSVFRNAMRAAVKWTVGARAFDTRVIILSMDRASRNV